MSIRVLSQICLTIGAYLVLESLGVDPSFLFIAGLAMVVLSFKIKE